MDIKNLLRDSLKDLDEGMKVGSAGETLRLFLLISKLAVLKNWLDLTEDKRIKKPTGFNDQAEHEEWCGDAKPIWAAFTRKRKGLINAKKQRNSAHSGEVFSAYLKPV